MFREFHWQNTYQSFASEQHSCMDCLTISCFTEHCWLSVFCFSSVSWAFSPSEIQLMTLNFFLCFCSIIHVTLPIYPRIAPLLLHSLKILPLFWIVGFFSFIQLLIYERTFSEFVHESHLPYNIPCAIVFQWKGIFRDFYSVFYSVLYICIFKYQLYPAIKEIWREQTLIKIFH